MVVTILAGIVMSNYNIMRFEVMVLWYWLGGTSACNCKIDSIAA